MAISKTAEDFKKLISGKSEKRLPAKSILYGVEGVGKTSLISNSKKPFGIMCAGETGLRTLMANNLIPEINHYIEAFSDWMNLREFLKVIAAESAVLNGSKSIFIDTVGTAWDLLVEYVTKTSFAGERRKFVDYGAGMKVALPLWREFLGDLDKVNEAGIQIWLIGHTFRELFKNPEGEDYHKYELHLPESILELTKRWADNIFFLNYFTTSEDKKGVGGQDRYLYAIRRPAFSAKNRCNLTNPDGYKLPNDPAEAWQTLEKAIIDAAKKR